MQQARWEKGLPEPVLGWHDVDLSVTFSDDKVVSASPVPARLDRISLVYDSI